MVVDFILGCYRESRFRSIISERRRVAKFCFTAVWSIRSALFGLYDWDIPRETFRGEAISLLLLKEPCLSALYSTETANNEASNTR